MVSETSKWRHVVAEFCAGNGIDIGSGGDPVVPHAVSIDLPPDEADKYTTTDWKQAAIQFRGDARDLRWFRSGTLDFVYSSHCLEDFSEQDWRKVVLEWMRVVAVGGYLIILVPETKLWAQTVQAGQAPNHNHQHEFMVGELKEFVSKYEGWWVVCDDLISKEAVTEVGTPEYTILFIAERKF